MPDATAAASWDRGPCPFCRSTEVARLAIGMPAGPEVGAEDPPWVRHAGCVHPGYTHECNACGSTWTPAPVFTDLDQLVSAAGGGDLEDLCDWISQDYELDAWIVTDDAGYVEIGFDDRGVGIEFPIPQRVLWTTLDELHEEVEAGLGTSG